MTKEKLVKIVQGILKTDVDLNFLLQPKKAEHETLVAIILNPISNARDKFLELSFLKLQKKTQINIGLQNSLNNFNQLLFCHSRER